MGSMLYFLKLVLPASGNVPLNAAIVLEGNIGGALTLTARVGDGGGGGGGGLGDDIPVTIEACSRLLQGTYGGQTTFYLVRPADGAWPAGLSVVLSRAGSTETFTVPIDTERDEIAPTFSSLATPTLRVISGPRIHHDVVAIKHGAFTDPASPIVLITLEFGNGHCKGVADQGSPGMMTLHADDQFGYVDAIRIEDMAGNVTRIVAPSGPRPADVRLRDTAVEAAFTCIAGFLQSAGGTAFVATSDRGSDDGFSRGHYLWTLPANGDLDMRVKAWRLTPDGDMPIELAFRGGFFGVTNTSRWFLYEHPGHWTGWQSAPCTVGTGMIELRVVQCGQRVTGYVNNTLAGTIELERPAPDGPVGIFFKGQPATAARISFSEFTVQPYVPV